MKNATIDGKGELVITPSKTSNANDFNFLLGNHNVHHKKLKARLSGNNEWQEFNGTHSMESLLQGTGNLERHFMNAGNEQTEGIALRLFDPTTRLWTIYWAATHSGKLDAPMIGSFEQNIGWFYGKDNFDGKPIYVQFKWDATNPSQPVWSQAFSADKGKTWEWNWHMYFSKDEGNNEHIEDTAIIKPIGVIELRNYVLKQGARDSFINYFEENLIQPQRELKGYPLGQYRIKGNDNNFFWIRGFENMRERSSFLPAFYYGPVWKEHRNKANSMIANNDNVHLLRPMILQNDSLVPANSINSSLLIPETGIAVIDFYTANTKLEQLLQLFAKSYLPLLQKCDINKYSLWTCEPEPNDFPRLPVFQDKNLLVLIAFYKDELTYQSAIENINSKMSEAQKADLQDVITLQNALILYPTNKTMNQ